MPSAVYAALALQAAAAADAVSAEGWTLVPMTAAPERDAPAVPDPTRLGLPFLGTFVDVEAKPDAFQYDPRQRRRPGVVAGKTGLIVSVAALATAKALAAAQGGAFAILPGDRLARDADGSPWSVASAFPLPAGTLRLALNLL